MRTINPTTAGLRALTVTALLAAAGSAQANIILNWFSPSVYDSDTASMDSALGIEGFAIEDFEDTTLLPILSYALTNPDGGSFTSLPNTYASSLNATNDNQWDGTHFLLGNSSNAAPGPGEGVRSNTITFLIEGGAQSFGIGLSNFQSLSSPALQFPVTDHELIVNGVSFSLDPLETLAGAEFNPGIRRNAYLRIDASGPDVINSVAFSNIDTGQPVDLLAFDHLAVDPINSTPAPVPEPSGLLLLATGTAGLLGFGGWRRRRP